MFTSPPFASPHLPSSPSFAAFPPSFYQRVTPTAEKPVSVAEYEASTGLKAKDWAVERARELGVKVDGPKDNGKTTERGFKD